MAQMDQYGDGSGAAPVPHPQPGFGPPGFGPPGFGPPAAAYSPMPQQPQQQPPHPAYAPQREVPPPYAAPQPPAGPDFLAADRRNAVVVDADGVSFEADGRTADFAWHELSTVHYKAAGHGHVLMVAVVLPDGRFYECAVKARNHARLQQWFGQLAPVLGVYLAGRGR